MLIILLMLLILYLYFLAQVYNAMIVHGMFPESMIIVTRIPINPKGKLYVTRIL